MAKGDGFRKYVEAGAVLGQVTRARAEEIVRELAGSGEHQREHAQQRVDDLVERSRKAAEGLVHLIRSEVTTQLDALGIDPENVAKQAADILRHSAGAGRKATSSAAGTASATVERTTAAAKKAAARAARRPATGASRSKATPAAKTTGTKKAAAKTTGTKKAAARATGTKKAAAKTTGTKKAAARATGTKKAAARSTSSRQPSS
ncbi:MAG: hypothetical protein ACYDHU_00555 [Acidimicrobiales bacterium]